MLIGESSKHRSDLNPGTDYIAIFHFFACLFPKENIGNQKCVVGEELFFHLIQHLDNNYVLGECCKLKEANVGCILDGNVLNLHLNFHFGEEI